MPSGTAMPEPGPGERRTDGASPRGREAAMDLVRHLVLENPTTLWIVLGIAAVVCLAAWSRTGSRPARTAAFALVAVGAVVGVLSWAVETDREKLVRTVRLMARAADTGNADALLEGVSPGYRNGPATKEALAEVVRLGLAQVRAEAEAPTIQMQDGRAVVTQTWRLRAAPGARRAVPEGFDRVVWQGVFGPDGDGEWRLRSAQALEPVRMAPEEAARYLRR